MRILPRQSMTVMSKIGDAIGRKHDYFDKETKDFVYSIEDENEGAALIGVVKDALSEYNVTWKLIEKPTLWVGIARFLDGDLGIAISTQHRNGKLIFCMAVG